LNVYFINLHLYFVSQHFYLVLKHICFYIFLIQKVRMDLIVNIMTIFFINDLFLSKRCSSLTFYKHLKFTYK